MSPLDLLLLEQRIDNALNTLQIILVIGQLLWAGLAGYTYDSRGRTPLYGFLAGLVLGPFGWFLTLVSLPNDAELEARAVATGTRRRCIACTELIRPEARVCHWCGQGCEPLEQVQVNDIHIPTIFQPRPPAPKPQQPKRRWLPQIEFVGPGESSSVEWQKQDG